MITVRQAFSHKNCYTKGFISERLNMQGIKGILESLKRLQTTIYLACEEKPADDIAIIVNDAAHEITTLRARVKELESGGWISVDTALPDDEITFLSFSPVYGFQVNMFNIHGNGGLPKLAQLKITHWQPLPEPPKK